MGQSLRPVPLEVIQEDYSDFVQRTLREINNLKGIHEAR